MSPTQLLPVSVRLKATVFSGGARGDDGGGDGVPTVTSLGSSLIRSCFPSLSSRTWG